MLRPFELQLTCPVSRWSSTRPSLNPVLDGPHSARHRSRAPPPRSGRSHALTQAWRLEASPAPHCDNGCSRRTDAV
eukprot:2275527-Prymnesium_polylepis.1